MKNELYDAAKMYIEAVDVAAKPIDQNLSFPNLRWIKRQQLANTAFDDLIIVAAETAVATVEAGQYAQTPMKSCCCRGPEDFHSFDCKMLRKI